MSFFFYPFLHALSSIPFPAIVSNFVSKNWPTWSAKNRPPVLSYGQKAPAAPTPGAQSPALKPEKPGLLSKILGTKDKESPRVEADGPGKKLPTKNAAHDAEIAQLCEMGFTIEVKYLVGLFIIIKIFFFASLNISFK